MTDTATAPAGAYAGGARSPIVHVYLCSKCAGYADMTPVGYEGYLSGVCSGCGCRVRELHRFPAVIDSVAGCACRGQHARVTGDLDAGLACVTQ